MKKSLILLVFLAYTAGCQQTARRTDHIYAPLDSGKILQGQTNFGRITAQGQDTTKCHIQARLFAKAPTRREAREILAQSQAKLIAHESGLQVVIDHPKLPDNRSVGGDLTLELPTDCGIDVQTDFGKIKVNNLYGGITAQTDFGDIHCEDIAGPVRLKTNFGKIKVRKVKSQNLSLDSDFGSLYLIYTADTPNPMEGHLSTDFGKITVYLPESYSGHINGSTDFGSVRSLRPLQVKGHIDKEKLDGHIGTGDSHVTAQTDFGSVRIH